jgi:Tol biopolymer transport system component
MKHFFVSILLLSFSTLFSQNNPEVYLIDITPTQNGIEIKDFRNISNDSGYDSQPSFSDTTTLLFAGNNDGQTDIAVYNTLTQKKTWFNNPTSGGEYSPQIIPDTKDVAAVRLDTNGLQRLYAYNLTSKNSAELIADLQVAYYTFSNNHTIVVSVLSGDNLDLVIADFQKKTIDTILEKSGRSIHKLKNKEAVSYTAINEEGNYDVFQLDLKNNESYFICQLPIGIQDHAWLDESKLILGSFNKLFIYDTFGNQKWNLVADLSEFKITNITRIAVSPDGKKLALVAEPL